jgi:hypothetical protein
MTSEENSRDLLYGGIEGRLAALAKSDMFTLWNRIMDETLQSWYPNLSEKEMAICEWTFCTMWDLNSGNSAMYIELVGRLLEFDNFANENEIEDVIKKLVSKSVLEARQEIWTFAGEEKSLTVLNFVQKDLYKELLRASNENFERVTNAYFYPRRKLN